MGLGKKQVVRLAGCAEICVKKGGNSSVEKEKKCRLEGGESGRSSGGKGKKKRKGYTARPRKKARRPTFPGERLRYIAV